MKIVTIIGARPQFVKAGAFSRCISENYKNKIEEIIVHTGQHYDDNMSKIFFDELSIPAPKYNLEIGSGSHGRQTGEMLAEIEKVIMKEKPDWVVVYGDTNSTLAGGLAASKLHIPLAHIEAGLRSYNMLMPEEQNRVLTDHIANCLFCPTDTAVQNLKKEGIYDGKSLKTVNNQPIRVKNTGDIMFDAILFYRNNSSQKSKILETLHLTQKGFILSTIHRAENTDDRIKLQSVFSVFSQMNEKVVLALHPRTKKYIKEYNIPVSGNVIITEPVGYLDMIELEKNAKLIMTDSGGVQKEAYFLRTPCITLREETEWIETLKDGWNTIAGTDENKILKQYQTIRKKDFSKLKQGSYFGGGKSAEKMIEILMGNS